MGKMLVALTFDDGPNTTVTPEIIDILEEYKIKGTFFVNGKNINENSAAVLKRCFELGHEICNHSENHRPMSELSAEEIKSEVESTSEKIENITGKRPRFFRPPYIAVNKLMYETIDLPFIEGIGCEDWLITVSAKERCERILRQVHDGAIILLHDSDYNTLTVEALRLLIPKLIIMGYEFVTVTQLFDRKGVAPIRGEIYTTVEKEE